MYGNFMTFHIIQSSWGESKEIISFETVRRRERIWELEFFMNFYQETKTSLEQSSYELVNFIRNWLWSNLIPSSYDVTRHRWKKQTRCKFSETNEMVPLKCSGNCSSEDERANGKLTWITNYQVSIWSPLEIKWGECRGYLRGFTRPNNVV